MDDDVYFYICIMAIIFMVFFGSIYLLMNPNSVISFSSPFLWLAFINAFIGIIICIFRIVDNYIEENRG